MKTHLFYAFLQGVNIFETLGPLRAGYLAPWPFLTAEMVGQAHKMDSILAQENLEFEEALKAEVCTSLYI